MIGSVRFRLYLLSLFTILAIACTAVLISSRQAEAGFNAWTTTGPFGGNILGVGLSPDPLIMWSASSFGGVFKTTDGGATWVNVLTGVELLAFASSPVNANVALAGTHGGGLLRTVDGGVTWAPAPGLDPLAEPSVMTFSADGSQALIIEDVTGSAFRSTDEGATWVEIPAGAVPADKVAFDSIGAGPGGVAFAHVLITIPPEPAPPVGGLFRSVDGGAWAAVAAAGLGDSEILSLAVSPVDADVVFAGGHGTGVFRSQDGGATFALMTDAETVFGVLSVAVSPDGNTVLAGTEADGGGIVRSTNGGDTFAATVGVPNEDVMALALSPIAGNLTALAGLNGSGAFKSIDGGATWTASSVGIGASISSLVLSPNFDNDGIMFAGSEGGGVFKTVNRGLTWTQMNTGLANTAVLSLAISPNFTSDQTVLAGTNRGGAFKTTNGGTSWVSAGLDRMQVAALKFAADGTAFAGARDRGRIFRMAPGGVFAEVANLGGNPLAIDVAPNWTVSRLVWAGTRGGQQLWRSADGGTTFSPVSGILPGSNVQALAVSTNFAADGTVFAGTAGNGIFRSTDGGIGFGQANAGLPVGVDGVPSIGSLATSPAFATDRIAFAGTEGSGAFQSTNGGDLWAADTRGLTIGFIEAMSFSPSFNTEGTVLAGTGNGVFILTIDTVPPTGTIAVNAGAAATNTQLVTLNLTAADAVSGVAEMRFGETTEALNAAAFQPFAATANFNLSAGDGTKTVMAQFRDAAGNISTAVTDTIVLDMTGPTGSFLINNGDLNTGTVNVTLNITAADNLSGVASVRAAESQAALETAQFVPFNPAMGFTLTGADGTKTVVVQLRDAAGNVSTVLSDDIILARPAAAAAPIPGAFLPVLERPAPGVTQIGRPVLVPLGPVLRLIDVVVSPNPFTPNGDGRNDFNRIQFTLDRPSVVTLRIFSFRGVEKTLLRNVSLPGGTFVVAWTGTNDLGKVLPTGNYRFELLAAAGGSQRTFSGIARVESNVNFQTFFLGRIGILQIIRPLITPALFTPNADGRNDLARIRFNLNQAARVTVVIQGPSGKVKNLVTNLQLGAGLRQLAWTGTDARGKVLPPGIYRLLVFASARGIQRTFTGTAQLAR